MPPSAPPSTSFSPRPRAKGDWLAPDARTATSCSPWASTAPSSSTTPPTSTSSSSTIHARVRLRAGLEVQPFFVRLTRDLVRLLQERTGDGYVFRTDLRLRPDPGSTPLAISTDAALNYYESVGQNWERAALIKARAVAGDIAAGESFLAELAPFIWRKYLDFAAIADIHAMKRQIHAFRGFGEIARRRPQHQGRPRRHPRDRVLRADPAADRRRPPAGAARVARRSGAGAARRRAAGSQAEVARELGEAYRFLRAIEHRLQMIADEQTQTLPDDPGKLAGLARFCGLRRTPPHSPPALPPSWNACRTTTFACSSTAPS